MLPDPKATAMFKFSLPSPLCSAFFSDLPHPVTYSLNLLFIKYPYINLCGSFHFPCIQFRDPSPYLHPTSPPNLNNDRSLNSCSTPSQRQARFLRTIYKITRKHIYLFEWFDEYFLEHVWQRYIVSRFHQLISLRFPPLRCSSAQSVVYSLSELCELTIQANLRV